MRRESHLRIPPNRFGNPETSPPKKQGARLTREHFLDRALDAISRDGRGGIGVHELVESIGKTLMPKL